MLGQPDGGRRVLVVAMTVPQSSPPTGDILPRLDAVTLRLSVLAATERAVLLTGRDLATGDQWDVGQVWAHLVEFIPYWLGQATLIIDSGGEVVPFGRVESDAMPCAAIETNRYEEVAVLWGRVNAHLDVLRGFIVERHASDWQAPGLHVTRGEMDLASLMEEFLIGHLEEHTDQLDQLQRPSQDADSTG